DRKFRQKVRHQCVECWRIRSVLSVMQLQCQDYHRCSPFSARNVDLSSCPFSRGHQKFYELVPPGETVYKVIDSLALPPLRCGLIKLRQDQCVNAIIRLASFATIGQDKT